MGAYLIDEISVSSPPQSLSVTGRAASMNTSYRTPKSQSYHQQTLGNIIQEIAERNGYTAKVDPNLAKIVVRHIDQTAESDMAFATRLAGEYDAVAKPVDGKLILAKRGEGKAITGETLPIVVIHEKHCTSWDFKYSARDEAGAANGLETDVGDDQKAAANAREPEEIDDDENFIHMDDSGRAPSSSESEKTETTPEKEEDKEKKGGVLATYYDVRSSEKKEVKVVNRRFMNSNTLTIIRQKLLLPLPLIAISHHAVSLLSHVISVVIPLYKQKQNLFRHHLSDFIYRQNGASKASSTNLIKRAVTPQK